VAHVARSLLVPLAVLAVSAFGAAPAAAAPSVLPDGRPLTPAGSLIAAGDFPAAEVLSGRSLFVSDAGETPNTLLAVDTHTLSTTSTLPRASFPPSTDAAPWAQTGGIALDSTGATVFVAGGQTGLVHAFTTTAAPLETATIPVGGFAGGVAVARDGTHLFVTEPFDSHDRLGKGSTIAKVSLSGGRPQVARVGRHPLAVLDGITRAGHEIIAVANRDDASVSILDPRTLRRLATVRTGRQPESLALAAGGSQLLVLNSLDDSLAVIDTARWRVHSRTRLGATRRLGEAPSAITVDARGLTAYVALGYENAVAVLARSARDAWRVTGYIPTAAYPTGVALDERGGRLFVTAGKGVEGPQGTPPGTPVAAAPAFNPGSSGLGVGGALEVIPLPTKAALRAYTAQVRRGIPRPRTCRARGRHRVRCVAPRALRAIKHVIYVIRENKTFDEELGDEPGGSMQGLFYGRNTTPNTHRLAERYALLQNFNSTEEVSDTGHQAIMGSVPNDWVQRFTQQSYGLDGAPRPGAELGNDDSVLWSPSDYLFDAALAHHVSFRDYGEFYRHNQRTDAAVTRRLDAHIVHAFPHFGFDPGYPDTQRIEYWLKQFHRDVAHHSLPALEVVYLPEDHTTQDAPGTPTAAQEVADSDLATGRLVDALSHSRYWRSSVVFLSEDDPQSGIDHVDEHRTVGLVIGPHVRRGYVTARHYDQAGMLRTIEEILRLPPLTEFDATATPMDALFTATADTHPFSAVAPSPPKTSPATLRAARELSLRRLGPHPGLQSVKPSDQRDIAWLEARGTLFRAPTWSSTERAQAAQILHGHTASRP